MSDSDEIGEELDRALRVTLTAAGQAAEVAARRLAERQRETAARSREEAAASTRELTAQRDAARVIHRQAGGSRWWDNARPEDVGRVWQTAQTWKDLDPQAAAAADLVRAGVQRKWGLDLDTLSVGDPTRARSPRQQGEDLTNALSDRVARRNERRDAALDREQAARLERVGRDQDRTAGPGAGADERDLATSYREAAEVHDEHAARQEGAGVDEEQVREPAAQLPYERARAAELGHVPAAAAAARLDSAPGFPASTRRAMHIRGRARAKRSRAPRQGQSRDQDRGR